MIALLHFAVVKISLILVSNFKSINSVYVLDINYISKSAPQKNI